MTDLNKLRSEFEVQHSDKVFKIVKFDEATNAYCLHAHLPLTEINLSALAEINYGWDLWQKAKAQAVPEKKIYLTCEQLYAAANFGAPNKDPELLETELTIAWFDEAHSGSGYYVYISEYPEEGAMKLESESGAEG